MTEKQSEVTIQNARVKDTFLGIEDHGHMTYYITVDYGDSQQVFGGYSLDEYVEKNDRREGREYGMETILRTLNALGVASWEKLRGTPIRVAVQDRRIIRIGHFLEDKWFDPKQLGVEKGLIKE